MKKLTTLMICFALTAFVLNVAPYLATAAEEGEETKLLCPVSGKDASKDHAVKYKGAEVYFCCPNCPKAFEADPAKFAVKANHQLVASGQYKQENCPISGGKLNPETEITVAKVDVAFCCNNCKGKVEGATDEAAQLELVFSDAAFSKGFTKVEKKKARD